MSAESVVRRARKEEALPIGNLALRIARAIHRAGAAVPEGEDREDERLHDPLPERPRLLEAGDREEVGARVERRADQARVQVRGVAHVGVGEEEEIAARCGGAGVTGPLLPQPSRRERRRLHDGESRVATGRRARQPAVASAE